MPKRVQVLLSSYNGDRYIKQQVNSILAQKEVDVHLLIRDDGSNDCTISEINEIEDERVEFIRGENKGATESFLDLIEQSGDYEYFAFSDQDDVWDDDKLVVAINLLEKYEVPAVYSSNTRLVDSELKSLDSISLNPKINLAVAIAKNYAAGCTMVMNRYLMNLLKEYRPLQIPFHDWWVNILALSVGGVSVFDTEPHISYRQHGNNVVGASNNIIERWRRRWKKFVSKPYRRDEMVNQIVNNYGDMINSENISILNLYVDYKKHPIRLIRNGLFKTGHIIDDFMFVICVLLKKA